MISVKRLSNTHAWVTHTLIGASVASFTGNNKLTTPCRVGKHGNDKMMMNCHSKVLPGEAALYDKMMMNCHNKVLPREAALFQNK